MCLILLALQSDPEFSLVVVGNRDEFHARPTAPAAFWSDAPNVLGGRDLQAGGTWLGLTRQGRFAAVTNYRDPLQFEQQRRSRGDLTRDFLLGTGSVLEDLQQPKREAAQYNDFNLLAGDASHFYCLESRTDALIPLPPGVYGVSNHLLDTPWPKVAAGKTQLAAWLAARTADNARTTAALSTTDSAARITLPHRIPSGVTDDPEPLMRQSASLISILANSTPYPDDLLPDTGISQERERLISAAFIRDDIYGTRSTTVVLRRPDGSGWFHERRFHSDGSMAGESGIML
jgi:uncharacterized protein with NRDE domain